MLKELATKSLAGAATAAQQVELADAWWTAAEQAKGTQKSELQAGAAYWYNQALGSLTGLQKTRAERRLAEAAAGSGAKSSPGRPAGQ